MTEQTVLLYWQRDEIDFDNILKAISSFVRTLVSFESRFDRYARLSQSISMAAMVLLTPRSRLPNDRPCIRAYS